MTGETETRLTEDGGRVTDDIETAVAAELDATELDATELDATELDAAVPAPSMPPPPRAQHAVPDRGRARDLFAQLAILPDGDEERLRIRGELVELHLPLVEYLARTLTQLLSLIHI